MFIYSRESYDYDSRPWKCFPHYWTFVREIHGSPVGSLYKGTRNAELECFLLLSLTNFSVKNRVVGGRRSLKTHMPQCNVSVFISRVASQRRRVSLVLWLVTWQAITLGCENATQASGIGNHFTDKFSIKIQKCNFFLALIHVVINRRPQRFCTLHNSSAVVTCGNCSDIIDRNEITVERIFHWIWIVIEDVLMKRVLNI